MLAFSKSKMRDQNKSMELLENTMQVVVTCGLKIVAGVVERVGR